MSSEFRLATSGHDAWQILPKARLLLPFLPEWQVMLARIRHKDQIKCLWQAVDTVQAALGEGLGKKRSLDAGSHTHARFFIEAHTSRRGSHSACSFTDEDSIQIKRQDYTECLKKSFSQQAPQMPVLFTGVKIKDVDRMSLSNLIREHAETMVRTSFLWPAWKLFSCRVPFPNWGWSLKHSRSTFDLSFLSASAWLMFSNKFWCGRGIQWIWKNELKIVITMQL